MDAPSDSVLVYDPSSDVLIRLLWGPGVRVSKYLSLAGLYHPHRITQHDGRRVRHNSTLPAGSILTVGRIYTPEK